MPSRLDSSAKLDSGSGARNNGKSRQCKPAANEVPSHSKSSKFASLGGTFRPADNPYKLGEEGSGTIKLSRVQDFHALKKQHCRNKLFEDVEFPADASSIIPPEIRKSYEGYLKDALPWVEWLRPKEIAPLHPKFFVDGTSRFDVKQQKLGDCWFMASLAAVADNPNLISRVVPQCKENRKGSNGCRVFDDDEYAGIFHFRFWQFGSWVDVVVDDLLPTVNGRLLLASSTDKNEFWCPLAEKAYAKLHGSYAGLKGGSPSKALEDLTGEISVAHKIADYKKSDLIALIAEAHRGENSLITFSSSPKNVVKSDIIQSHSYTMKDFFPDHKDKLLTLRNPWGSGEWEGKWSDEWMEKNQISEKERIQLGHEVREDGEFLIPLDAALEHFIRITICYFDPALSADVDNSDVKKWEEHQFVGKWVAGKTAGGNYRDSGSAKFWMNPKYSIELKGQPDDTENWEIIVGLTQNTLRFADDDNFAIGFYVFDLKDPESPVKYHSLAPRYRRHTVGSYLRLPQGTYTIIPCTREHNVPGTFLLRVFSKQPITMIEEDNTPKFEIDNEIDSTW